MTHKPVNLVNRVFDFNERVVGIHTTKLKPLEGEEAAWLRMALQEELQEFVEAETLEEQVDALLDSCIFALGGLRRMGLTRDQANACARAVLDANDQKAAGKLAKRGGDVADAVKPENWVSPDQHIKEILT